MIPTPDQRRLRYHITYSTVVTATSAQEAADNFMDAHDGFGNGETIEVTAIDEVRWRCIDGNAVRDAA